MGNGYANDAADLQKLQPLTQPEQAMYEQIKNNFPELHKFIVTRTYLRNLRAIEPMIDEIVAKGSTQPIKTTKFPKMPDEVSVEYAIDLNEQMLIARIKFCQGAPDDEMRRVLQCD
jgi:hypothetical protein